MLLYFSEIKKESIIRKDEERERERERGPGIRQWRLCEKAEEENKEEDDDEVKKSEKENTYSEFSTSATRKYEEEEQRKNDQGQRTAEVHCLENEGWTISRVHSLENSKSGRRKDRVRRLIEESKGKRANE